MSDNLKIWHLCNRIPFPPSDGGSLAMARMAEGLKPLCKDYRLFSLNTSKHFVPLSTIPSQVESFRIKATPINNDVSWWGAFLHLLQLKSYHIHRFYSKRFLSLLSEFKHEKPDWVLLEGLPMMVYAPWIIKNLKCQIAYRAHNVESLIWKGIAKNATNPLKKVYLQILYHQLKNFEHRAIRLADVVIPISKQDEAYFIQTYPQLKSQTITMGASLSFPLKSETSEAYQTLIHLAAMNWLPNVHAMRWFLRHVWPEVVRQRPKAKFYLGGKNIPDEFMNASLPGLTVVSEVKEVDAFMNLGQILVVPLFEGSGIRIKIIEGMAAGKAIVASPKALEAIEYLDKKNVWVASDAHAFIQGLIELLDNQSMQDELGREAIQFARQNFDLKIISQQLMQFLAVHTPPNPEN